MGTVERRLELLKMEGLGFSQPEVVKQISEMFQVSVACVMVSGFVKFWCLHVF